MLLIERMTAVSGNCSGWLGDLLGRNVERIGFPPIEYWLVRAQRTKTRG
jgi:hypothetical protein